MTCYPEANLACEVVSERDNLAWRRPRERPRSLWLGRSMFPVWSSLEGEGEGAYMGNHAGVASKGRRGDAPFGLCLQ